MSLLLAAYLLNALRVFLPGLIGIKLGIFIKGSIPYGDLLLNLLDVDILHFAGLSFLFIGLLRRLRVPERAYPVIGLLLVGLNYLVRGISTGQIYIDSILGLFWGASETSYFPFLSWIMYPLAGAAFGHALKASDNKRVIYIKVVLAGGAALLLAMLASGFRFMYYMGFPEENMYAYFHEDLIGRRQRLFGPHLDIFPVLRERGLSESGGRQASLLEQGAEPHIHHPLGDNRLVRPFHRIQQANVLAKCPRHGIGPVRHGPDRNVLCRSI